MIAKRLLGRLSCMTAVVGISLAMGAKASAEELRNPRLQRSLQALEEARTHLDMVMHHEPREMQDGASDVSAHLDRAIHSIHEELDFLRSPRQLEPHARETDRPMHAAKEDLARAIDELMRGVSERDLHGRTREAFEEERSALDRAERFSHREEELMAAPPPPVVELREPHLQHALQRLETAREYVMTVEHRERWGWHEDARLAREDIDSAMHEVQDTLAAAGVDRSVEVGRAHATDRPIHEAREQLHMAMDEIESLAGSQYHGHERRAIERTRMALEDLERLMRHE